MSGSGSGGDGVGACRTYNGSDNDSSSYSAVDDKFTITNSCALFDFAVYTILMGILSLLGIVGNSISFAVLLRDRGRSTTSFLLQALALADTLVLLAAIPLYIIPPIYPYTGYLHNYYSLYLNIIPYLWPIYLIPYTATIFVTVLVSMHRYCAVCRPFCAPSKVYTARQTRIRVAIIAIFSVLYNIPRFFEYQSAQVCVSYNTTKDVFEISPLGSNKLYRIIYANVLYSVLIHGGPLLSIIFFNIRLIMALKRRQRRWAEMGKGWYQQDISLVLVVVMCVFIVCQTPTFVDMILWTVIDEEARICGRWHYYYTAIGDTLAILNSSVNFVIYILTSRNFRHGLMSQPFATRSDYLGLTTSVAQATLARLRPRRASAAGAASPAAVVVASAQTPTVATPATAVLHMTVFNATYCSGNVFKL